jgi:hypothetical protein
MKSSKYDPKFNPAIWKRPSWRHFVNYHILCGEKSVGKTTLYYEGWHELASVGVYRDMDLDKVTLVEPTKRINRFDIVRKQHGLLKLDSWLDCDGESFGKLFCQLMDDSGDVLEPGSETKPAVRALKKCRSGITLIIPAHLFDMSERTRKAAIKKLQHFHSPFLGKCRIAFWKNTKCRLVISQAGDLLPKDGKELPKSLQSNIQEVVRKSGLADYCKRTLVVDSFPENGWDVCRLAHRGRGLSLSSRPAGICSAGVALAWIMGLLPEKRLAGCGFVVDTY